MSYYYYYYEHVLSCLIVLLCGPFLSVLSLLSDAKMCGQKREGICHLTIFVHTGRIYCTAVYGSQIRLTCVEK